MANLLLTFFLLFLPFSISSSPNYTFPNNYFINCGSETPISVGAATFSGDQISDSRYSHSVKDTTTTAESAGIYETARKFTKTESYKLRIEENGVYMVRLHFFPFFLLRGAKFNVSASGFLLLSNFSIPSSVTSPVIKEFLVPVVNGPNLEITFTPYQDSSSFAFVNAIEAFVTPEGFIPNSTDAHVTPRGNNSKNDGGKDLSSSVLNVIHRINVGGSNITSERDTMRRNWVSDDNYLFNKTSAKNHSIYSERPKYDQGGEATQYDAPDFVYRTAKEMNIDVETLSSNDFFNITWLFDVKRNATFFVRLHLCDIVSDSRNNTVFNVYIYGLFGKPISPYDRFHDFAVPFYVDFVVDSDGSGFMNISVGPRNDSKSKNAFLNGVEIMELINDRDEGSGGKKNYIWIIVGSVGGVVVLISVSVVVILCCLKSRKAKPVENSKWPRMSVYAGSTQSRTTVRSPIGGTTPDMNLGLKIPFAEILHATNKFDPKFIIGEGGFGKVYKGTLHNGVKVAVKRSEAGHGQGLMEFQTEITLLSKIRHQHLVSLIGYCDERYEMILVYEFMEKGTLREHLYSSNEDLDKSSSRSELSWDQRLQICIGAANGLQYLHAGLNEPIIHRDIKSTNILLDEHYVAKVADFGLSKSGPPEETHIVTDVKGSFGYLDPEYMKSMQLTQKSDVYSFGVVLLEVLCARPAVDSLLPRNQINLAEWGLSRLKENQLEKIIDPFLAGKINPNSLRKFGETAEKCLQENGTDRPNMMDVLWDLNYVRQLQHPAMPQQSLEDTTTDASWQLALPGINRLPSINATTSCVSVSQSEVFSELRTDDS